MAFEEMLPIVGGPLDGDQRPVQYLMPFIDGGVPSSILRVGDHWYELHMGARQWVYMGKVAAAKEGE